MSLESVIGSLRFRNKFSEVQGRGNRWYSIDTVQLDDVVGDLLDQIKAGAISSEDVKRFPLVIKQRAKELRNNKETLYKTSVMATHWVFRNIECKVDKEMFFYVNKETGELLEGNTNAICFSEMVFTKEDFLSYRANAPAVRFIFDPTLPYGHIPEQEAFNRYRRIEWENIEDIELPICYPEFFDKFCPDPFQRANIYAWAYFSEVVRLNYSLVLYATKGTGKSTFIEILKALHGREFTVQISDGYFDNKFSGEIEGMKLAILEEVVCRGLKAKSKLKAMMNDYIVVEKKGQNPKSNVRSFCNFIFTTNSAHSLEIDPDDRRFYVPDISNDKMPTSLVVDVLNGLRDLKVLKAIRKYFQENMNSTLDLNYPVKDNKNYWEMVRSSAPDAYDFILSELESSKGVEQSYAELKTIWGKKQHKFSGRFPQRSQVKRFFDEYKPNGKHYVITNAKGTSYKIEKEVESTQETKEDWEL